MAIQVENAIYSDTRRRYTYCEEAVQGRLLLSQGGPSSFIPKSFFTLNLSSIGVI